VPWCLPGRFFRWVVVRKTIARVSLHLGNPCGGKLVNSGIHQSIKMKHALVVFLILTSLVTFAQSPVFQTSEGAIKGYDPVAYFTQSKPVKGKKDFSLSWQGATWYFSTAQNRDLFKASPEKYAPQYGGYCAYGISRNYKVKIEPEAWTIYEGKLYLNYDLDVSKNWNEDKPGYIKKANTNWATLKDKK
jgi:YHS domain-containing protein